MSFSLSLISVFAMYTRTNSERRVIKNVYRWLISHFDFPYGRVMFVAPRRETEKKSSSPGFPKISYGPLGVNAWIYLADTTTGLRPLLTLLYVCLLIRFPTYDHLIEGDRRKINEKEKRSKKWDYVEYLRDLTLESLLPNINNVIFLRINGNTKNSSRERVNLTEPTDTTREN